MTGMKMTRPCKTFSGGPGELSPPWEEGPVSNNFSQQIRDIERDGSGADWFLRVIMTHPLDCYRQQRHNLEISLTPHKHGSFGSEKRQPKSIGLSA